MTTAETGGTASCYFSRGALPRTMQADLKPCTQMRFVSRSLVRWWLVATRAIARAATPSGRYQADLATVFPDLSGRELRSAARDVQANRFTRGAMRGLAASIGWEFLPDLVEVSGGESLVDARSRGPVIVVAWHAGIGAAVLAGLERLGQSGVVVRQRRAKPVLGFSNVVVSGASLSSRTAAFLGALKHVRAGGLVVFFIDAVPFDPRLERSIAFLDRRLELPRGPAALQRLTGAPLFHAEACWTGAAGTPFLARFEDLTPLLEMIQPAGAGDDERLRIELIARHFETRLRERPGDLWPVSLRQLATAPKTEGLPLRSDA